MSNNTSRRQAKINANRFGRLMKDIERDVGKRTKNSKNMSTWIDKTGLYVNNNPFKPGGAKYSETVNLLNNIMSNAKFKGLSRGGTAELVKGVISENTMHYVTRMGDDMKNNLRKIAVESYNQKLPPGELAKKLQKEVQGLSKSRAQAIARTETMRASNLSNYVNAKMNMGAKSYKVISASGCCDRCDKTYKNGKVWFDIDDMTYFPPLHPNCRCVAAYSTKTADKNNGKSNLSEDNVKNTSKPKEYEEKNLFEEYNGRKLYKKSEDYLTREYDNIVIRKTKSNRVQKILNHDNIYKEFQSWPSPLKKNIRSINVSKYTKGNFREYVEGFVRRGSNDIHLLEVPKQVRKFKNINDYLNTARHEAFHVLDNFKSDGTKEIMRLSSSKEWNRAIIKDNEFYKLNKNKKIFKEGDFISKGDYPYPSDYAGTSISEDFAESGRRFLDPKDKSFAKQFPNRYKYMQKQLK